MQTFPLNKLNFIGHSLSRPECAVCHVSGIVFAPDWTGLGGVSVIFPNGDVKRHLARTLEGSALDGPLRPNGICLLEGGDFLIAHLGDHQGGIFRLKTDGTISTILSRVNGEPLPPCNFVTMDQRDRLWVTVSTREIPRAAAYRSDVEDGFIVLVQNGEARIVADDIGYTNECLPHPDGERLFVNETFARRLTSFDIGRDGTLSNRRTVANFGGGTFPDGLAFDSEGSAWITSIISNRLLRVDNAGNVETFLQDVDPHHLTVVERAWETHTMGRPHLDKAAGTNLRNVSSLAFCGDDLDHAVLGCLLGDRLPTLTMPVSGQRPVHWTFDIEPLIRALEDIPTLETV